MHWADRRKKKQIISVQPLKSMSQVAFRFLIIGQMWILPTALSAMTSRNWGNSLKSWVCSLCKTKFDETIKRLLLLHLMFFLNSQRLQKLSILTSRSDICLKFSHKMYIIDKIVPVVERSVKIHPVTSSYV